MPAERSKLFLIDPLDLGLVTVVDDGLLYDQAHDVHHVNLLPVQGVPVAFRMYLE